MSQRLLRNYLYNKNRYSTNYEREIQALEQELMEVLERYPTLSHYEKTKAVENVLSQEQELCEDTTQDSLYEPVVDDFYDVEDRITYSQKNEMIQRSRNKILNNYWDKKLRS
jgi:cell fate (sporulation/competence/biofilm development) regulator YmcA (YheA/YmcA/DUF963 family)